VCVASVCNKTEETPFLFMKKIVYCNILANIEKII